MLVSALAGCSSGKTPLPIPPVQHAYLELDGIRTTLSVTSCSAHGQVTQITGVGTERYSFIFSFGKDVGTSSLIVIDASAGATSSVLYQVVGKADTAAGIPTGKMSHFLVRGTVFTGNAEFTRTTLNSSTQSSTKPTSAVVPGSFAVSCNAISTAIPDPTKTK